MIKCRIFAIFGYFVPFILIFVTRHFTKWGHDIEKCIFAFLVGVAIQCIIGILGLVGIRRKEYLSSERMLFMIDIIPMVLFMIFFLVSSRYRLEAEMYSIH